MPHDSLADDPPLLWLDDVSAGYPGGEPVVRGVTLRLRRGVRTALLGANGSGKTTVLRVLAGAHQPTGGQLRWQQEAVRHNRSGLRRHRERVQFVGQDPDDHLLSADVRRDLSFGPVNLGLDDAAVHERVEEALGLLDLHPVEHRPVHQLSFGQRKRVALAGAMAMRPSVLLLDEPTAGLDHPGTGELHRALRLLEDHGTTVVLSTHDSNLAWDWADQVVLLAQGQLVSGSPTQMLTDEALLERCGVGLPWAARANRCANCG